MLYLDSNNTFKEYRHSFTPDDLDDLMEFILERKPCTMREVALGLTHPDYVVVRHDVDHNLEHARNFARIEKEYGVISTYFVLTDAWYMDNVNEATDQLQEILSLGHEIGLHHYCYRKAKGHVTESIGLFENEVRELNYLASTEIDGCSAHGGGEPNSLELWEHCKPADFGLSYEAYHLHRAGSNYISDNRGRWRAPLEHVEGKQTHLLVHPCHWDLP